MAQTTTDQQLVARTLAGDQDAFRELVLRYQSPLFRLVLRLVRDRGLAEDLVQEAFIKAYGALDSYQPERKLSSWLFKIAHNTAIDSLRRKRLATVPIDKGADDPDEGRALVERLEDDSMTDPERRVVSKGLAADVEAAIDGLEPIYRELVVLRFQEGLAYHEIAEVLDLPMGTVKTRLHRGRKRMMELLAAKGWAPGSTPGGEGETPSKGGS